MELLDIFNECKKELLDINIPLATNIKISLADYSAYFGKCFKIENGYEIKLSRLLFNSKNEKLIKKTIAHELIHTCPSAYGHSEEWFKFVKKADSVYNYGIMEQDDNCNNSPVLEKWICPVCGATLSAHTISKTNICGFCNKEMVKVQ